MTEEALVNETNGFIWMQAATTAWNWLTALGAMGHACTGDIQKFLTRCTSVTDKELTTKALTSSDTSELISLVEYA